MSEQSDKRGERCMHGVWKADHCYACEKMGNEIYGAKLTKEKIEEWRKDLVEWNEDPSDEYVKEVNQLCDAAMCAVSATTFALPKPDAVVLVGKKSIQLSYFGDVTPEDAKAAFEAWIA